MDIRLHPHARIRMVERGATENEARETIETRERFPAEFAGTDFWKDFVFQVEWNGQYYINKANRSICEEDDGWTVISLIVRYF